MIKSLISYGVLPIWRESTFYIGNLKSIFITKLVFLWMPWKEKLKKVNLKMKNNEKGQIKRNHQSKVRLTRAHNIPNNKASQSKQNNSSPTRIQIS